MNTAASTKPAYMIAFYQGYINLLPMNDAEPFLGTAMHMVDVLFTEHWYHPKFSIDRIKDDVQDVKTFIMDACTDCPLRQKCLDLITKVHTQIGE